jgi:hypothetical protein
MLSGHSQLGLTQKSLVYKRGTHGKGTYNRLGRLSARDFHRALSLIRGTSLTIANLVLPIILLLTVTSIQIELAAPKTGRTA